MIIYCNLVSFYPWQQSLVDFLGNSSVLLHQSIQNHTFLRHVLLYQISLIRGEWIANIEHNSHILRLDDTRFRKISWIIWLDLNHIILLIAIEKKHWLKAIFD